MNFYKTALVWASLGFLISTSFVTPASAQTSHQNTDMSPVLLLETGPSDNPNYRRMVFVKYLSGNRVTVAYKAYNRAEFTQIPDTTPDALIQACSQGPATSLQAIRAYQASEAEARRRNEPATISHFCIKDVPGWEAGNRSTYLDPIFEGMPHAAALNN